MDKLFDTKRKYTGYDGEEYVDMSIPVVNLNDIQGNSTIRVNHDENGRLDNFVWRNVAKNLDMIDTVMYANHIFNPFAVKEGELLYVPIDNDRIYKTSEEPALPDGTKQSSNMKGEKKKSYAEQIEYLARMGLGIK